MTCLTLVHLQVSGINVFIYFAEEQLGCSADVNMTMKLMNMQKKSQEEGMSFGVLYWVGEHIVYGIWKAFNVNDMFDMCANMLSSLQSRVEHLGCLIIYWKGWGHEPAPDLCVRYVTFFAHVFVSKDPGTCRFEEIRHDFCSHCEFHPTLGHCRAMLREGKHRKHT